MEELAEVVIQVAQQQLSLGWPILPIIRMIVVSCVGSTFEERVQIFIQVGLLLVCELHTSTIIEHVLQVVLVIMIEEQVKVCLLVFDSLHFWFVHLLDDS